MKIPLNWLRDYVELTLSPGQLIERLTLAGLEVAAVRVLGLPIPEGVRVKPEERGPVWERDKVLVGEVVSVDKHPNADRLSLPTVTYGEGRTRRLVTGAPNVRPGDHGQKVVLALTGAKLYDGHAEVPTIKELKPSKIRGEPSDAMVCSLQELGITFDAKLNEGILFLEPDAPVGTPLADLMGDIVLEVDVLPNMARCLSMLGVAREVAALTGQTLKYPAAGAPSGALPIEGQVRVRIDEPKLSARYAAALIEDVQHGEAPGWMQRRLLYAGMRPISNIVDITNYVMLEWGQPLHAFDYDVLVRRAGGKAPTIIVRPALAGETLTTLDGTKRELSPDNLVIADEAGPIALAGVMGGAETEVTDQTKNILLESANFDAVSIRRTMKQFNLPSEASVRFSRGIHPELVKPALARAADLMRAHAGGQSAAGIVESYPAPPAPQVVELTLSQVRRLLGMDFPLAEAVRILRALEFEVATSGPEDLRAVVPAHRRDIQEGPADLIEEIVRIHGYDRLPATLLADRLPRQHTNAPIAFEERLRDLLVSCGLQEVITYALTTPAREAPLLGNAVSYVELRNPISSERSVLRQSLLASVLEVAAANLRHTDHVRLFELGFLYVPRAGQKLPDEPRRLALVLIGRRRPEYWEETGEGLASAAEFNFFDIKSVVAAVADDLHLADVKYQPAQRPFLHPGRAATLWTGTRVLGDFGQLHPRLVEQYDLGGRTVLAGEFDVDALQTAAPGRYSYAPVPRFPAALRDIAVVVADEITNNRVIQEIRAAGAGLLKQVRLFDLYHGDSIPAGTKSLAYALSYQADDRTLLDKEVDKAHKKIEDRLKHVLKAQIRGKE
jgi:phenylalanyl-tRNA synthetase beta chain